MCMKCGCSIPNDKKSTNMVLPNGSSGVEVVSYPTEGKYV
jgi:hypothetical protein